MWSHTKSIIFMNFVEAAQVQLIYYQDSNKPFIKAIIKEE